MPSMIDPSIPLRSFQDALSAGLLTLERGRVDRSIFVHIDKAGGKTRFTYVQLEGKTVAAFATFVHNGYFDGHPNLATGYAVPEVYRNQGRARSLLQAGIAELRNGFKGFPPFFVEAVISSKNFASLKVAEAVLGGEPEELVDSHSGEPALRYACLFEPAS